MNPLSPNSSPALLRVFIVSLLSFALLTTPLASAASLAYSANAAPAKPNAKGSDAKSSGQALEDSLFVKQPTAAETPAPQAPAPQVQASALTLPLMPSAMAAPLAPGTFTATLAAALTGTANNGNGQADPGDTINYTATLNNQTGSDATALGFSVPIDSHTTLSSAVNSTPVAFDQAFPAFNEDSPAQSITLQGQDPDGSNIASFTIVDSPTKGALGSLGSITCAGDGVCSASINYTPNANANGTDSFTFRVNDGTSNSNEKATVSITINAVNDPPTFTQSGGNQTSAEDAGTQQVLGFVTAISAGPADEVSAGQTVSFAVSNNNNSLFSTQPAIDSSGKLTYTAGPDKNGTATITYHAVDTGSGVAPNVNTSSPDQQFTITITPVNDKPIYTGAPKSLTVQSHMKLVGATGLLAGVTDPDANDPGFSPQTLQVDPTTIDTTNCKSTINAVNYPCLITVTDVSAGTFNIDPPPGVGNGTVLSFTYKVKDNGNPAPGILSDPITVSVTVQGPIIWFVDPVNGTAGGRGTLADPFKNLASANDNFHLGNLGSDQRVFVYSGATEAGAGVSLSGVLTSASVNLAQARTKAQWLIGQGAVAANFDTLMGISPPSGTITRPNISSNPSTANGMRPTIKGTVAVKENCFVSGVNIDVSAGSNKGLTNTASLSAGTAGSTVDIKDVNVKSAGGNAVDFSSAQTVNYTTSDQTNSPNTLISTTGIAISVVSTTIGAGGMTFQSINHNASNSGTNSAVVLNTTGSGTFTVTGNGGSCTTATPTCTGGTIQNIQGADAIKLTSTGGLVTLNNMLIQDITASNDSSAANDTRSNVDAIQGQAVNAGLTLNNSIIQRISDDGINGSVDGLSPTATTWNGLTITNSTFLNTNRFNVAGHADAQVEGAIYMQGLKGTVSITGSTFQNAGSGIDVNTDTSGSLSMTVQSNTFNTLYKETGGQGSVGNFGISVTQLGTLTSIVRIGDYQNENNAALGNTFTNAGRVAGIRVITQTGSSGTMKAEVSKNTFTVTDHSTPGCVGSPCTTYNFPQGGILYRALGTGNFEGIFAANTMDQVMHADGGLGQFTLLSERGTTECIVRNNTFKLPWDDTVEIRADNNSGQQVDAQVLFTGNTYIDGTVGVAGDDLGGPSPFGPWFAQVRNNGKMNLTIQNEATALGLHDTSSGFANSFQAQTTGGTDLLNVFIQNIQSPRGFQLKAAAGTTYNLFRNGSASGTAQAVLHDNGDRGGGGTDTTDPPTTNLSGAGTVTLSNTQPTLPVIAISMLQQDNNYRRDELAQSGNSFRGDGTDSLFALLNVNTDFSTVSTEINHLAEPTSTTAGDSIWTAQLVAEMAGNTEKSALSNTALLDHTSGALGIATFEPNSAHAELTASATTTEVGFWKMPAPASHTEADATAHGDAAVAQDNLNQAADYSARLEKASFQPMAEKVTSTDALSGSVSNGELSLSHALAQPVAETNNATVSAFFAPLFAPPTPVGSFPINGTGSGFKLPNGKSVTITFQVTVKNPPNMTGVTPPKVSFQGTLQGSVGTIVTDDPATVATPNDATVTLVDLFNTTSTITGATPSSTTNTGQAVTFTASIVENNTPDPAGGTLPSGTATFKDGGSDITGCVNVTVTSGSAQCTTSALTSGTHSNITVVYNGDGNFDPSTSAAFVQTVTQSSTTVTVTSSLNPSLVTQNVTFTATVASGGGFSGPPTGTVTFKDGVNTITCSNAGGQTLSSGVATCQIATLAAGNHSITAVYGGDTNFTGNTGTLSAAAGQNGDPQVVNKSNTTMTLITSASPVTPGTSVTFTATINSVPPVNVARTGTVTFYKGTANSGNEITDCGASGVVTVSSNQAQCATTSLTSEGSFTITAVYSGDGTYNGITNTVAQNVAKNGTTTAIESSKNPSAPADSVTFTATVTSSAGTPTGKVTFTKDNVNITSPNCVDLSLDVNGKAQCTIAGGTLSDGNYAIKADFTDASNTFSASSASLTQQVVSCTATTVVTNTNDSGAGSLRQAIASTCANGTVTFSNSIAGGATNFFDGNPHTITLLTALAIDGSVQNNLTIQGPGASVLTVDGNNAARVFTVNSGKTVSISGMTVTQGKAPDGVAGVNSGDAGSDGAGGGAILNSGTLTLTGVVVSNSNAGAGGAGNGAAGGKGGNGGGVYNAASGTLNLVNSTVSGNKTGAGGAGTSTGAGGSGGGVYNLGALTANGSTFSNNMAIGAEGTGGGATSASGTANFVNSTLSGNKANGDGGGLLNTGTSTATLTNVTVTTNRSDNNDDTSGAGGGIRQTGGTVTLNNTIVAGNFKGMSGAVAQVETATVEGSITAGSKQVETLPVNDTDGAANNTGSVSVNVTINNVTTPFTVAIANGDTADIVADKIEAALAASSAVNTNFDVASPGATVTLTAKTEAPHDPTLNMSLSGGNLDAVTTSTDTTDGTNAVAIVTINSVSKTFKVPVSVTDDASTVAGKMRTALSADSFVTTLYNVSSTGAPPDPTIVLTANTPAANDASLNIETDNGANNTSAGLTHKATSANTTAGYAGTTASDVSGTVTGSFNLIGDSGTSGGLTNGSNNNQVGVAPATVFDTGTLASNGGPTQTVALKTGGPAIDTGSAFGSTTDQRGFPRPVDTSATTGAGDESDIGAYEKQNPPAAPTNPPDLQSTVTNDTGASQTDNITKNNHPAFDISVVISGATVELLRDTVPTTDSSPVVASGTASGTSITLTDNTAPADGVYYYSARQRFGSDASARTADLTSPNPVTIDTVAPAVPSITANPTNPSNSTGASFSFNDSDPSASFLCQIDGGGFTACTSPQTYSGLSASSHTFDVKAADVAGNESGATSFAWTIDTTVPTVTINQAGGQNDPTNSGTINFTVVFSKTVADFATGDVTPGGTAGATTATVTGSGTTYNVAVSGMTSDGTVTATIGVGVAHDAAGNDNAASTSTDNTVTYDTTTPAPSITQKPNDPTNQADATFGFSSTEAGVSFQCKLDSNSFSACTSTTSYTALGEGSHTFTVKATDTAGNENSSSFTWNIDLTPPNTNITSNPTNPSTSSSATFNFTSTEASSTFTCQLDGNAPEACNSGTKSYSSLGDGSHTFTVKATDPAGNPDPSAASFTWTVDTTAPTVTSVTRADSSPTSAATVHFTVTFSEAVTGVDVTDFSLSTPGLSGAAFAAVNPVTTSDNIHYTVTVDTGSGDGTIRLDVLNDGTIKDAVDHPLGAAFVTGEVYSIIKSNPTVASISATDPNPTNLGTIHYAVTFTKNVTGVDSTDFQIVASGVSGVGSPVVTPVDGSHYTVTITTGTGDGTIGLNLVDDDSIEDSSAKKLGGTGAGNGNFTGEVYTVDKTIPTVTSVTKDAGQADPAQGPTSSTVINFTVTFSESVTGFDSTDIILSGTAGATVANVTGSGTTYNVGVEGMTQSGSVTIQVKAGAAFDGANNTNAVSGTATVQFVKDNFTAFEVNTTADTDDGSCDPLGTGTGNKDCTLREAINLANNDGGAETITFNSTVFASAGGPYTINLTGALPNITSDMTINGPGANVLTVKRNTGGNYRIFTITDGSVTIDGLTISNGNATGGGPSDNGGGISINTLGTVNITNSAISGNSATVNGGGIAGNGSTLNIINSTISGNTAFQGGGAQLGAASVNITNSTISGNSATGNGGGILTGSVGTTGTITDSTITNNRADSDNSGTGTGGGIFKLGTGTIILRGGIVAANYNDASPSTTPDDIGGTIDASSSYNLIGTGGSGGLVDGTNNNQVGVASPGLNPLANNGGPTLTHALQCTSPAIDKGKAFGQTTDQRGLGFTRPFDLSDAKYPNAAGGDGSDIGALEVQSGAGCVPVATPPNPQPSVTNEDTLVTLTLKGTYSQNTPLTFTITQNPANGTLSNQTAPNCTFTTVQTCTVMVDYTPNLNYNGGDLFKFKVSASGIDSEDTDVTITVNPVNDAPVAGATQNLTTDEDTALPVQLSGTDIDSASLSFIISTPPAHGTLSTPTVNCATPGNCTASATYTPNPNYNGPDQFKYKVNDGSLSSADAVVNINVHSIADTPSVTPATTSINKQTTSGLVISRNAVDGAEIGTFIITNIQNGTLFRNNGTTQINNGDAISFAIANAGLKFTPNHNLSSPGTTFSFDIQAANNGSGDGGSAIITANITVSCSATSVVTNSNDSGAGSLRDVIFNACPGGSITFNIPTSDPGFNATTGVTTITLSTAELLIDRDLTITGPGANKLTVKRDAAAPDFRIFNISPATAATVNISGLTITGGSQPGGSGGGISIAPLAPGQVNLSGVAVTGNTAHDGGGISITTDTVVNIINSLVATNTTSVGNGGGILKDMGSLTVVNSTISGNRSANNGGGINNGNQNLTLTNVTLTNNRAIGGVGGGIQSQSAANTVTLNNSILAGNFQTLNSNIPDNFFDGPAPGSINTAGSFNNIFGSQGFAGNGNQQNVADPGLAPLADNGGPTLTHLLLPSSPAIDKGNNSKAVDQLNAALTTDQRGTGFARISNTTVDIGALEVSYANAATAGTPQSATINAAFSTQLKATIKENGILKANIPVTFTAPASGASGTFAGNGTTVTVNTDVNGVATAPTFTANGIAGSYNVTASLATGQPTSTFALTNNTATTSTTLTSSVNPSDFGETVIFTATVTSAAGTPTGTVQFQIDGANVGSPVTLSGGVATFSTSTLSVGNHPVAVSYAGDGNYLPSNTTLAGGQQVVNGVPTLSINDVTLLEGNSGTTNFVFTVTLSASSHLTVKVDYATADGTATTADNDYQAKTGTLTFTPGQTTQTITVPVNSDTKAEANENFFVNLSNPQNAAISDNQGQGTILSEDTPIVEFSAASYTVAESGLHATIVVKRLGDLSKPATVDYATSDPSGLNNCSQITGNASQRCDYATVVGTLRFAAGESSKTIFIPIVNDVYVEGPEFFTITLSNLVGVENGAVTSARVNITDDDNGGAINPITDDAFFIRQLYIDFLGREPEPAGLQGWLDVLHRVNPNQCKLPTDCDRIDVALGFVRSPEFQDRGYFIFRFYTTALGRNPNYNEFIPDMARLSGFLNPQEVEQNKNDFVAQFMSRQEFKLKYDPTIGDPTSYVDKLLQTVGLPNHPARNAWINGLTNNSLTRAQVLRQLIESTEVYTKFYNQAIIVMDYFGFLRRDPDAAYQTWIDIFNHTDDYRVITNGFMNSPEYPLRFGP